MSSLENIYQKMAPTVDLPNLAPLPASQSPAEAPRQMSREVAHDLNNILTIIRGYADRMLLRHRDNPSLRPDLQLISESARRAELVVRQATQVHRQPAKPTVAV